MKNTNTIETIGSITKMEHLVDAPDTSLPNTLVLKNTNPFPGIKLENIPERNQLVSYFIILCYRYASEKVNRIGNVLFNEFKLERFPGHGEIICGKEILPCLRLKKINPNVIKDIQHFLKDKGLKMKGHQKFDSLCRIKIFKSFRLIEISNDLYRDLNNKHKFYIQINRELNWKRFNYIIKKIKYNLENQDFDAALGLIYRFTGPQNVIRIYDKDTSQERSLLLKKMFISEIKKEVQISAMHL